MKKLPLITYCTPSHQWMLDQWLLPSLPKGEFVHEPYVGPQQCTTARFHTAGWTETVTGKVKAILDAIERHEVFVFADTDIQFFRPVRDRLLKLLGDHDAAFSLQRDNMVNSGFFIMRATGDMVDMWRWVLRQLDHRETVGENKAVIRRLKQKPHDVVTLPTGEFWTPPRQYHNIGDLKIPTATMRMHHATYAIGGVLKRQQLEYVAEKMNVSRRRYPVVVSFWTSGSKYKPYAEQLKTDCDMLGLDHDISEVQCHGSYVANILLKGPYVHAMLKKHQRPILWVDADHKLHRHPDMLADATFDFAAKATEKPGQWLQCEKIGNAWSLAGGALYFNYTPVAVTAASRWDAACRKRLASGELGEPRNHHDERSLWDVLVDMGERVNIQWLPQTYWHGNGGPNQKPESDTVISIGRSDKLRLKTYARL